MPAKIEIEKDPIVMFEVLDNGSKYIKVKKSETEKLIKWKALGGKKYRSVDNKYKVYFSNDLKRYVVKERVSDATRESSDYDGLEYIKTIKEFCSECFQICDSKEIIYRSSKRTNTVCKNCEKILVPCDKCSKKVLPEDLTYSRRDKKFCTECAKDLIRCDRCSSYFEKEEPGSKWYHDYFYCARCVKENFRTCNGCGESFYIEDLRNHRGLQYCQNCMENVVVIKDYNYTPDKFKFHKLNWDNDLCLGLEVEVETNHNREEDEHWAGEVMKYLKGLGLDQAFYIKHDGTVQGFELVAQPMTLQFIHKNIPWYEILKWFRNKGFTSYKSGNCGMHVHLSKDFFTSIDVHKLRLFFAVNKIFIYKFSKRFGYNDKYCQYENFTDFASFLKNGKRQDGKYWAVRTRPGKKNTVEFRVFRGTLSYPRFLASLQFCDALAHYIKMVSILSCQNKTSWINFIRWCTKDNKYQHFIKYIQNDEELKKVEV